MTPTTATSRAPYQVIVIPFHSAPTQPTLYCLFRRRDEGYWQWIAGGGEGAECPAEAALREASEEGGFSQTAELFRLQSIASIPVTAIQGFVWGNDVLLVPEHSFALPTEELRVKLSSEHVDFRWCAYEEAATMLKWDSNKTALWELDHRLRHWPHTLVPA